ncbi:MAG: hypothetical protein AB1488_09580 [Nitrospirota bacterium]
MGWSERIDFRAFGEADFPVLGIVIDFPVIFQSKEGKYNEI